MIRNLQLAAVGGLLRVAGLLLDRLEIKPDVDAPITSGDPGGRYAPPPKLVLRVLPGGAQDTDSDSCPRNDVPSDERAPDDHPDTPGVIRP
jgi:hypothetical protein